MWITPGEGDDQVEMEVAAKMMNGTMTPQQHHQFAATFKKEFDILSGLNHENIVQVR